jgi:neutral ceramidase
MGTNVKDTDTFVAAFANSNCGDVSGDAVFGVTLGQPEDFEHTKLYGRLRFEKAKELFDSASRARAGPRRFPARAC